MSVLAGLARTSNSIPEDASPSGCGYGLMVGDLCRRKKTVGAPLVLVHLEDLWSGSCEEIGRRIKVATVVEMVQPLDCKREPHPLFHAWHRSIVPN